MSARYEKLLKAGELALARTEAEAALRRDPGDRRALVVLAKLAAFEGDEARAEALLKQAAVGNGVGLAEADLVRAALLMRRGELQGARALYRQVSQAQPTRSEAFYGLGFLLAEAGEFKEACQALERAVELEPDVASFQFQLGRVLLALRRRTEAFDHLEQALRLNPKHLPTYQLYATALRLGGELVGAEELLREGLKTFPHEPHLLRALSQVLAAKGDLAGAVAAAEALARVEPNHPLTLATLARLRLAQRRLEEALDLCRALSERGQATAQSRTVEAMVHEAMNPPDVKAAIEAWRSAMELDPEDWAPANNLGHLLMRAQGWPDAARQAREALEEAHRRAPAQAEPRLNLALLCATQGDKDRARELASELVARGPGLNAKLREQAERLLKQLG